jgi:hypothetical protein
VTGRGGAPAAPSLLALREALERLVLARSLLGGASEALRAVERRLHASTWDAREPFMARRGRALCAEATGRFARVLDTQHALLASVTADALPGGALRSPRSPRTRRLLVEIRHELRGLQLAFDGGSMLLARAIDTFDGQDEPRVP